MNITFIGLGVMGYAMAGHLAGAGHSVTVYNRSTEKARRWQAEHGGKFAETPAQAAAGAELVMVCVGNDSDVRAVVLGESGALAAMSPGSLLIDHTTASADLAESLAEACQQQDCGFLDAPVSGGSIGAEQGVLSIMVGGKEADFERALPVMGAYGKTLTHLGPVGAGQRCKMVNQICAAGIQQALAEAVRLAQFSGLDIDKVIQVLAGGAAQSWQLEHRARTMADGEFDFGFALDWMRKDLDICLEEGRQHQLPMPMTQMVDGFLALLQEKGMGRADSSVLIELLPKKGS